MIELLNDTDFINRTKLQLVVVARKIIKNNNVTEPEKDFARRVLQNPNDNQRVSTFVTLILAGSTAFATWDSLDNTQKDTLLEVEVRKVYKEGAYIKE